MINIQKKAGFSKSLVRWLKETPAVVFFIVFFIISLFLVPRFSRPANLFNIVVQASDLIILSCGMTFIFINASIDFSVTGVLPLASMLGAMIMKYNDSFGFIILAVLAMLLTGIIIGALNGFCVAYLHMPSFIGTMVTQLIFTGIALTLTQSKSIGGIPNGFNMIAQGSIAGIPFSFFITVLVVFISGFLLNKTIYGRRVIAIGVNQKTAAISGIPVRVTIFSIFVYCGFLSSLASIIMTARLGAGIPQLGKDMLMDIVGAVVVGGTAVSGGKGNLAGTVIAAIFMVTLSNSLNLMKLDWYFINVCKGLLILVVSVYGVFSSRQA